MEHCLSFIGTSGTNDITPVESIITMNMLWYIFNYYSRISSQLPFVFRNGFYPIDALTSCLIYKQDRYDDTTKQNIDSFWYIIHILYSEENWNVNIAGARFEGRVIKSARLYCESYGWRQRLIMIFWWR